MNEDEGFNNIFQFQFKYFSFTLTYIKFKFLYIVTFKTDFENLHCNNRLIKKKVTLNRLIDARDTRILKNNTCDLNIV